MIACAINAAHAQVIADSVADFSGEQGLHGWSYGFYDGPLEPSDFQPFEFFSAPDRWHRTQGPGGYWTSLETTQGHPNGIATSGGRQPVVNWAVRRWVSPFAGPARIDGRLWKLNTNNGDGVIGHIFVDGVEVWSHWIAFNDGDGVVYSVDACLSVGSTIDFAIDPNVSDGADHSGFTATIRGPISEQPVSRSVCPDSGATFAVVAEGVGPLGYRWQCLGGPATEWTDLEDGANSVGEQFLLNAAGAETASLAVDREPAGWAFPMQFRCVVSDSCGSVTSEAAALTLCLADFNCDGALTVEDFTAFRAAYLAGDMGADYSGDGVLGVSDFTAFRNAYLAGCP